MIEASTEVEALKAWALEWVEIPSARELLRDKTQSSISTFLAKGESLPDVGGVAGSIGRFAMWRSMVGVKQILDGQHEGWIELNASNLYLYWNLRIVACLHQRRFYTQFIIGLDDVASCLAHAIVSDDREESGWLGERLVISFQGHPFGGWPKTPFEPFMARLFQIWRGQVPPSEPSPIGLGVYQAVLDAWDEGGEPLRVALMRACDYHLLRTEDRDDSDYPEFTRPPYVLFPAEILAIIRVRQDLDLSTPKIVHPLMQTALAQPPDTIVLPKDELLDRLIGKVRSLLPDV